MIAAIRRYEYVSVGVRTYTDETAVFGAWYDYTLTGYIMEDGSEFEGPMSLPGGAYAGQGPEMTEIR